jgi:hypothetical protein
MIKNNVLLKSLGNDTQVKMLCMQNNEYDKGQVKETFSALTVHSFDRAEAQFIIIASDSEKG